MNTILVVDDKPAFTTLYKRLIESDGRYAVFTENKGSCAVEAARKYRPDLIILDILMPDMLGSDVAAELRADPALLHTKVIFVTAMLRQNEVQKANESIGGHTIIAKPTSGKELFLAIEQALGSADPNYSAFNH